MLPFYVIYITYKHCFKHLYQSQSDPYWHFHASYPGEAAGLALGLVMLGSKSAQAIEDMVGYAQETQHEKILRGLAVGIALVMYGRMEEADTLIESLCRDKVRLQYILVITFSSDKKKPNKKQLF